MNIIILTAKDKTADGFYSFSDNRANHIINILKSKVGDTIEIGLLNGKKGIAKIISIEKKSIKIKVIRLQENEITETKIEIICALPRPQTLKKVFTTIATMGVSNLYLIRSNKVEKSFFQSTLLKEENYKKYLIEGLSQGKRTQLPEVSIHKRFKHFIEHYFPTEYNKPIKLIADTQSEEYINSLNVNNCKHYVIAIGPEGGWTDFEVSFMLQNGFMEFKLSRNILRVETAVTAALAQLELVNSKEK
jgi:RsmE family RNA methyltransferase